MHTPNSDNTSCVIIFPPHSTRRCPCRRRGALHDAALGVTSTPLFHRVSTEPLSQPQDWGSDTVEGASAGPCGTRRITGAGVPQPRPSTIPTPPLDPEDCQTPACFRRIDPPKSVFTFGEGDSLDFMPPLLNSPQPRPLGIALSPTSAAFSEAGTAAPMIASHNHDVHHDPVVLPEIPTPILPSLSHGVGPVSFCPFFRTSSPTC